jgi:hypothetical protein
MYLEDSPDQVRGYHTADAKCRGAQGHAVYTVEPVAGDLRQQRPLRDDPALRAARRKHVPAI